jgi:glycosyltransferase involved in cell wall biosynthesis
VRILYVVTSAGFGGASMNVLLLMRYMVEKGHTVGLISANDRRLIAGARELGVRVFVNPYFVRRLHLLNDIRAFIPVYKAIKEFKPDLIHAHSTKAGLIVRFWSALLNFKPVIFTAHGWAFTEGRKYWKRWLLAKIEKIAAIVTTKIICVSNHDKELALKFKVAPLEKLTVVYNGVDPKPFLNAQRNRTDSKVIVTFVGRLAPPKDLTMLLKAVKPLAGIEVLIVGDGELRKEVEKYILKNGLSKKVFLLGEREDVPEILVNSDVFVLPSRWEGLPFTIIEAMMAGLPVIASKVGGVPELVDDGITGFLVPPGDYRSLAQAIQKLVDDKNLREVMGKNGREKALKLFTVERMLSETAKVYDEVLRTKKLELANVKND